MNTFPTRIHHLVPLALAAAAVSTTLSVEPAGAAELSDLVEPGVKPTQVAGGCEFTEGPAWSPEGYLLFSDIPNDRIVQLLPTGETADFLKPSGRANGLQFDQAGRLFICQGGERRVSRIDSTATKKVTVLADSHEGKKLNSPNDLALDAHGGLYFTDPRYGQGEPVEQPVMGVYYIDLTGKLSRVIDSLERPNGILVSPDGKRLHVAEPNKRQVHRYEISGPGILSKGEVAFTGDPDEDGGGPDGMAHDALGNIYATYKGITILDPEGKLIGRIPVPERPANCKFGGKDMKTLFITARKSVYSIPMRVAGKPLVPAGPGAPSPADPAAAKTREVKLKSLVLQVPEAWKEKRSESSMRLGEFEIPAVAGDKEAAELVVFYFGQGGAGTREANIERWIQQFPAEGRVSRVLTGKAAAGEYSLVDVTGTFEKPFGPPIQGKKQALPGARMLAIILSTADGDMYLKLTGPSKTVSAAAPHLRRAIGADEAAEKEKPR
ncbi:MAG TPA: SMP-30/gluconolactonase/LRE family protein [Planctomycetota bacterium]|nr:SMP-30/gluconolactonase/LRE family protein [Planctomycetota bacterium]